MKKTARDKRKRGRPLRSARDPRKVIHRWMKKEMREKGAQRAELRRTKRRLVLKKGIPSVPSLVMHTDQGLPFVTVLYWQPVEKLREIRLYYFDAQAAFQLAETFTSHHDLEALAEDIKARTKLISRYPPPKTEPTVVDVTTKLNQRFHRVWDTIMKKFRLPHPKKLARQRPLVRIQAQSETAPFQTAFDDVFIYFAPKNPHLPEIFTLYSIFFLLPSKVRETQTVSMCFALSLLQTLKSYDEEDIHPYLEKHDLLEYYHQFQTYSAPNREAFFRSLFVITDYYQDAWSVSSFVNALAIVSRSKPGPLHKADLPQFFLALYRVTAKRAFLHLVCILRFEEGVRSETDLLDPSQAGDQILLAVIASNYNQGLTDLYDAPEVFGGRSRKILIDYIHSALNDSLEVPQVSHLNIEVINPTDLEIIIHAITKTSRENSGDIFLRKEARVLTPHSRAEISLTQPVTQGDRVHLHYHFNTITNHRAVRSLQGTTYVEIK